MLPFYLIRAVNVLCYRFKQANIHNNRTNDTGMESWTKMSCWRNEAKSRQKAVMMIMVALVDEGVTQFAFVAVNVCVRVFRSPCLYKLWRLCLLEQKKRKEKKTTAYNINDSTSLNITILNRCDFYKKKRNMKRDDVVKWTLLCNSFSRCPKKEREKCGVYERLSVCVRKYVQRKIISLCILYRTYLCKTIFVFAFVFVPSDLIALSQSFTLHPLYLCEWFYRMMWFKLFENSHLKAIILLLLFR